MALTKNINVMWFRQDLRLADNPALTNALEDGKTLPIFILDDFNSNLEIVSILFIKYFELYFFGK